MENNIDQTEPQELNNGEIVIDKKSMFPTFVDLAALFGIFILSQVVGVFAMQLFMKGDAATNMGTTMLGTQLLSLPLVIITMLVMRSKRGSKQARVRFSSKGFDPMVLLSGFLMMLSITIIIEPLLAILPTSMPDLKVGGWQMLVSIVVVAPILEEFICRGLLLESLRAKRGVVAALLLSSLFFALMHIDGVLSVNAFFLGLVLGYIYIITKSIFAPIILHAINNTIAYVMMLFDKDTVMIRDMIQNDSIYYGICAVAMVVFVYSSLHARARLRMIVAAEQVATPNQEE